MDEFKKVEYFNVIFEVNRYGIVKRDGKIKTPFLDHDGYLRVGTGTNRSVGVHRLVALAFVENDDVENKTEVNHLDYNRQNPRWDNLEWVTHKQNIEYSKKAGHYKGKFGKDNPNYGNKTLANKYKNNPQLAKEKQSRPKEKNGNAKRIALYDNGVFIKEFDYIGGMCEYMIENYNIQSTIDNLRNTIRSCILKNKLYRKRFTFEYVCKETV